MPRRVLYLIFFVSFLFSVFLLFLNFRISKKVNLLADELSLWQARVKQKTEQTALFKQELDIVKTEIYLERIARENLNLKKPEEQVVVFTKSDIATTSEKQNNKSFWLKIKELFNF